MSTATQYKLNNQELIKLILKENNIRTGKWTLMVDFGVGPGQFGPDPSKINPGIMVAIQGIGINLVEHGMPIPESLVVDAANLWD